MLPESESATHYSEGIVRVAMADDESVQEKVAQSRRHVFETQDRVMLEAQQRLRRILQAMLETEAS